VECPTLGGVRRLKLTKTKLVVLAKSGKKGVKKGDNLKPELQDVARRALQEIIPVERPALRGASCITLAQTRLVVLLARSGKKGATKGGNPKSELQNDVQNTLKEIIPMKRPTLCVNSCTATSDGKDEKYSANIISIKVAVNRLKLHRSRLLVFPATSGKKMCGKKGVTKGDNPKSELQNGVRNTLKEIIPVERPSLRGKSRATASDETDEKDSAHKQLKKARISIKLAVNRLELNRTRLLVFSAKSGKKGVTKGDDPKPELQDVAQSTLQEMLRISRFAFCVRSKLMFSGCSLSMKMLASPCRSFSTAAASVGGIGGACTLTSLRRTRTQTSERWGGRAVGLLPLPGLLPPRSRPGGVLRYHASTPPLEMATGSGPGRRRVR
jgi:hypothetical protein